MAAQTLQNNTAPKSERTKTQKRRRLVGVLVLTLAPIFINIAIITQFGSSKKYSDLTKSISFINPTLLHVGNLGSTCLMSLVALLVRNCIHGLGLDKVSLLLYLAQFGSGLVWDPLVHRLGAVWLAFLFGLVQFGTLLQCYDAFGTVSPATKTSIKACLVWVAFRSLVAYKLVYLFDQDLLFKLLSFQT